MFKKYKLWDIANFSQWKQVEIWDQYPEQKDWYRRFLRIVDFTNENEPIRYVENYWDRYYASKDDLVMIRYWSQTAWKVVIWKEWIIANNMFKINLDNNIVLNKYMYYYLSSEMVYNYLRSSQNSSTMPAINFWLLNSLEVEIPPLEYQQRAITCLDKLNNKIELNNQINHNLYQINDKLFNEYFWKYYDWDLPNDWKLCKLTDYANINNWYSYTWKELVDDSEIWMVTIKNFERNGWFKLWWFKPISPLKNVEKFILNKSDIVVACTDLTQNADIVWNTELIINTGWFDKIIYSMDVVEIEPINIDKYYLYATLKSSVFKNFALEYVSWSTVLHLSKNCFKDFELIIPDEQKMKQFSCLIKANCDKIMNNTEMNIKLTNMRDTLLPKLMNWEINLDNVTI